jgi:hypothetical protein
MERVISKEISEELGNLVYVAYMERVISNGMLIRFVCYLQRERVCRCGAGQEQTAGDADTPGFPLQTAPSVVMERQRCQKLRMPRNHPRINQTSLSLIKAWRGNCDVQILIYDSDPDAVDLREISKVTDYVVAYSCKGNATHREEVETTKRLILGMEESTCDENELKRVCKQVMNKASSSRLISKPEATVLLANLPLSTCSEYIETVSLSDSMRLTKKKTPSLLDKYKHRPVWQDALSLHAFYMVYRKQTVGKEPSIPHFVGVGGVPDFPVSEGYARFVLIVYKPWRTYPDQASWKEEFNIFITSPQCPRSCKLTYNRVVQRFYDGTRFAEPVATNSSATLNPISEQDAEAILLAGMGGSAETILQSFDTLGLHKGLEYNWARPPLVRSISA